MSGLSLSRRNGESILIGGNIRVTVVQSVKGKAKLVIQAPPSLRIDRGETLHESLHESLQKEVPLVGDKR